MHGSSSTTLANFYRQKYPTSLGWTESPMIQDQKLCLVNRSDDRYVELVEIFSYTGSRVEVRPSRYLVTVSRVENPDTKPCGAGLPWIDLDLL